jgi:exoribonuclease II
MSEEQATTQPGTVGFLAEGGKLVAVRIDGSDDGKLVTRSVDGKERRINRRRLLWLSEATVADLKGLSAHWEQTRRGAIGWDAAATWQHLAEGDALEPCAPTALHARLPAPLNVETIDGLVLAVFDDPLHFRMRFGEIHPISHAAMETARQEAVEAAKREAALNRAVSGLRQMLQGEAVDAAIQEDVDSHLEILIEIALNGQDGEPKSLRACLTLLASLELQNQGDPRYLAFDTLVALGRFEEDENLSLLREGMSKTFSDEVLSSCEQLATDGWSATGRKDYTEFHTVAIDAPHTTEVDDAFTIDGNRIVVFIADADALVGAGTVVDLEARRRSSTLYLPNQVIPMLPASVGQGSASLSVDVDRPALAMSFRLDADGGLVDFALEEAVCRLNTRLSYAETDLLLQGKDSDAMRTEGALVRMAQRLMTSHRAWRVARGALQLQRSEVDFEFSDDGAVSINSVEANGPARQLISEMMICVCAGAASWCAERDIPAIYRCQARPVEGKHNPKGQVVNPAEQAEILRRLQPTMLSTNPGLHFTLALDAYTQVSSPLRRYSDLIMHRQIKATLRGRPLPNDERAIRELCNHIERQAAAVRRVENDSRRYWTLKYLAQNPTQVRTGVCIRPVGNRWLIAIDAIAQRTLIRTKRRLQAGVGLAVVVDKVDARRNKIVMREAE